MLVPNFPKTTYDWELEEMTRFLHTLHDQNFRSACEDKLC